MNLGNEREFSFWKLLETACNQFTLQPEFHGKVDRIVRKMSEVDRVPVVPVNQQLGDAKGLLQVRLLTIRKIPRNAHSGRQTGAESFWNGGVKQTCLPKKRRGIRWNNFVFPPVWNLEKNPKILDFPFKSFRCHSVRKWTSSSRCHMELLNIFGTSPAHKML